MDEKNTQAPALSKKKALGIRIGVVSVIIIVIAGIFIFKSLSGQNSVSDEGAKTGKALPLNASKVDLDKLKAYKLPMVIDFGSDSCVPCQQMAPVLETLHEAWQGKVIVQFVDVWKYTKAADGFPVSLIPTQIFYNADGTPYVPSESIQKSIEFSMYSDKTTGDHLFTVHQGGLTEAQMRQIFAEMGVE